MQPNTRIRLSGKATQVFKTIELAALYEAQHKRNEARDLLLIEIKDKEKNDNRD